MRRLAAMAGDITGGAIEIGPIELVILFRLQTILTVLSGAARAIPGISAEPDRAGRRRDPITATDSRLRAGTARCPPPRRRLALSIGR